jgi:hypothetical protein
MAGRLIPFRFDLRDGRIIMLEAGEFDLWTDHIDRYMKENKLDRDLVRSFRPVTTEEYEQWKAEQN